MPICVPVRDMRDTAAFLRLVEESPQPITVTKNGYDACVVMRSRDYDRLQAQAERVELYASLMESQQQEARGEMVPASEALAELRGRYAI